MQGTVSCVSFCFSRSPTLFLSQLFRFLDTTWRWRSPTISVISTTYLIMHIILMLLFCVYECLSYLIMHNIIIERAVTHSIIHIIIVHDFTVRPLLKRPDNTSISLSFSVFVKLQSYPKLLLAGRIVQYYLFDNINRSPHAVPFS